MPWYANEEELRLHVDRLRADWPDAVAQYGADRWIRIMCDYTCEGVWAKSGGATSPGYLPITLDLIDRIYRWQETYETNEYWDPDGVHWTEEDTRAFAEVGLAIAIEMKRQLPDWTVIYHDESRSTSDKPSLPGENWMRTVERLRPWFEYEITPEVVANGQPPDNYPK